jgi:hypothetical protein
MSRVAPLVALVVLVVGAACPSSPPPSSPSSSSSPPAPPAPPPVVAAPVVTPAHVAMAARGEFPPDPAVDLVHGRCAICHSTQYLTSQRLTPAQWEKTLKKMRGWGAPLDDAEQARLQAYLAAYFTPSLPPPPSVATRAPVAALATP